MCPIDLGAADGVHSDLLTMHDEIRPTCVVLRVTGELDLNTVGLFQAAADAACRNGGSKELVVDISGVTFCDVAGLRGLIDARQSARSIGWTLTYSGPTPFVRRLAKLVGLQDTLGLTASSG